MIMKFTKGNDTAQKPVYKKWWFWIIILVVLGSIFGSNEHENTTRDVSQEVVTTEKQVEDKTKNTLTKEDEKSVDKKKVSFIVNKVRNDVTGNWRIATIAENIDMKDYALDYYKENFKSDKEIHAIVNFNYNTTTRIAVMGNALDVSVYEYVSKEEYDAKLLFSGMLLKEFYIDRETGKITEINN